ncbi:MerR family transcriptional regulator [Arthrobacter sp. B1805]|uniref:MerR family transcriptional regulator n=1 Tax=Arthrobacter sp. B1805 TaxID=2058892 RepID=UPI000CE3129F|nr:MerR family transcriptional regulator [Arthrobacter sp. B1805]
MRLSELSAVSGISPASIKFYLRSGLLEPGQAVHPTRAEYGDAHVRRLRLIQGLRSVIGLGLEDIRRIIEASDGAETSGHKRLALLATVQSVVLGFSNSGTREPPTVKELVLQMGWPDEDSEARAAVGEHLAAMTAAGVAADPAVLVLYARAADAIADAQLTVTDGQRSVEELILTAAVGMHLHNQLILKVIALAQASRSIQRYAQQGPHTQKGRDGDASQPFDESD